MAKKSKETELIPLSQLQTELFQTHDALQGAYARFDAADDPELVESCIFAINALRDKYSYLLRCIKIRTGQPPRKKAETPVPFSAQNITAASQMKGDDLCL